MLVLTVDLLEAGGKVNRIGCMLQANSSAGAVSDAAQRGIDKLLMFA